MKIFLTKAFVNLSASWKDGDNGACMIIKLTIPLLRGRVYTEFKVPWFSVFPQINGFLGGSMIGHGYLHVDLGCRNKWLSNWGISRALQSPIILSDQHTRGGSVISQRLWTLGSGFKFCPPNNLGSNLSLRDPNNFVTACQQRRGKEVLWLVIDTLSWVSSNQVSLVIPWLELPIAALSLKRGWGQMLAPLVWTITDRTQTFALRPNFFGVFRNNLWSHACLEAD